MTRNHIAAFGALLCLAAVGFSDTALGQNLTFNPTGTQMNFEVLSGGATKTQTVAVSADLGPTTLLVNLGTVPLWMTINGYGAVNSFFTVNAVPSATLNITVNTAGLSNGPYDGQFTIQVQGFPANTATTYHVHLNVGTASVLTANPSSLSFSATQGSQSGTPSSSTVVINSSGAALQYSIAASTTDGNTWLLLSSTTGMVGDSGFQVYVNPSQLAIGSYTGMITVQSTTTTDSVTIPVALTVTAGSVLNVTPTTPVSFIYQFNSSTTPAPQTLQVTSSTGSVNFQVSTSPVVQWLSINPLSGTATQTPTNVVLTATPAGLPSGTYTTTVIIQPAATPGVNATTISVSLVVSSNPILAVDKSTLTLSAPFSSTTPITQSVNVSSTGAAVPFQASSDQTWLSANPTSGSTPQVLTVAANPSGLAISNTPYVGHITLRPVNSDQNLYTVVITVSLTITNAVTTLTAGPQSLLFSYETGQSQPFSQVVGVYTAGQSVPITVTTQMATGPNCTQSWLNANSQSATAPAQITVSISTTGLSSGTCSGFVQINYNSNGGSSANTYISIPVTINIASTPLLTVSMPLGFGQVSAAAGSQTSLSQTISVSSTDGSAVPYTVTSPNSWLAITPTSGNTPQTLQVVYLLSNLPAGSYQGSISISSANLPTTTFTIPVTLTLTSNNTVSVSPSSLKFTQPSGGALPAPQNLTLTTSGGSPTFTATVSTNQGTGWLQVSPTSGSASGTIAVSIVQNTLSVGTYTGQITLAFQNAANNSVTIPVTLTVTQAQTIVVSPTSLSFAYQTGGTTPQTQTLSVTSTGGSLAVTATALSSGGWLKVTPGSGSTGSAGQAATFTVSADPSGLTIAGSPYTGTITFSAPGAASVTVQVMLTITGVPQPQPATIANAAAVNGFGAIAPGEWIQIRGTNLGPSTPVSFTVNSDNTISNTLSGVQVLFDGIPGTPVYVSSTQINAIVPYEIAGRSTTNVIVSYQNTQSAPIPQTVAPQAPGIYTLNALGQGQAVIANQNGGYNGPPGGVTVNGTLIPTSPAPQGSVVTVYMTGCGQTTPASTTGTVIPIPQNSSQLLVVPNVTAAINGVVAPVQFAGGGPTFGTGTIIVNVKVPTGVTGNALPIVITVNGYQSIVGPTIAVQ